MRISTSFYDSVTKLKAINLIRMVHKVDSLSEISSADSKEIDGMSRGNNTNDIIRNGCD